MRWAAWVVLSCAFSVWPLRVCAAYLPGRAPLFHVCVIHLRVCVVHPCVCVVIPLGRALRWSEIRKLRAALPIGTITKMNNISLVVIFVLFELSLSKRVMNRHAFEGLIDTVNDWVQYDRPRGGDVGKSEEGWKSKTRTIQQVTTVCPSQRRSIFSNQQIEGLGRRSKYSRTTISPSDPTSPVFPSHCMRFISHTTTSPATPSYFSCPSYPISSIILLSLSDWNLDQNTLSKSLHFQRWSWAFLSLHCTCLMRFQAATYLNIHVYRIESPFKSKYEPHYSF